MLLNGNKNILKQESNKHLEKSTSLRKDTRTDDSDNHLLNHAMNYIEQLNEMRFIEKISRPI